MKYSFKTFNATLAVTALAVSSLCNSAAYAANDGTLGATSTGDVTITVEKAAVVQISGMTDMDIPSYTLGDGDQHRETTVCVYSSTASGGYKVTVTGSGAAGAYTLTDGSHTLAYTVIWNSGGAGSLGTTGSTLTAGTLSGAKTLASTTSFDCNTNANPTAQLNINFAQAALDAAPAGNYTGVATVLITPN
jgi:hypothetical protein